MADQAKKWSGAFAPEKKNPATSVPDDGGGRGRSALARSLRSWAPGQPTDPKLEQSKHQVGAVYVAVKVLGDQAAACRVKVRRLKAGAVDSDGERESDPVDHSHPLCRLLRRPNNKETGGELRKRWVQQLCLTGDALTWRLNDGNGLPAEMWSIPSGSWQPVIASPQRYPEGAYRVLPYYGLGPFLTMPGLLSPGGVVIPAEETLRMKYPHPLVSYDSYSPLTACSLQLDALEAVDRSRWYGMQQGCNPSATVELDPSISIPDQDEMDRLKEEFASKFGGPQNVGRVAVLSPGATLKAWSHPPGSMGWEDSWSQLVDFVLSVFSVTKSLAFMSEASSYAALYASLKQFNLLSMSPLLQMIADNLNVQLVWPNWGEDYYVELEAKKVDDEEERNRKHDKMISVGAETINELRVDYGLKPVPWGDTRAFPGNVSGAAQAGLSDVDPLNDAGLPGAKPPGKDLEQEGPEGVHGVREESPDIRKEHPAMTANRPRVGAVGAGSLPGRGILPGTNGKGH